jgi:hypothetical protein
MKECTAAAKSKGLIDESEERKKFINLCLKKPIQNISVGKAAADNTGSVGGNRPAQSGNSTPNKASAAGNVDVAAELDAALATTEQHAQAMRNEEREEIAEKQKALSTATVQAQAQYDTASISQAPSALQAFSQSLDILQKGITPLENSRGRSRGVGTDAASNSLSNSGPSSFVIDNGDPGARIALAPLAPAGCTVDLSWLAPGMPMFADPRLRQFREGILRTSTAELISKIRQSGMTRAQAVSESLQAAQQFNGVAKSAGSCVIAVSGLDSDPFAVSRAVQRGLLRQDMDCTNTSGVRQPCECMVVAGALGSLAARATAHQINKCMQ